MSPWNACEWDPSAVTTSRASKCGLDLPLEDPPAQQALQLRGGAWLVLHQKDGRRCVARSVICGF